MRPINILGGVAPLPLYIVGLCGISVAPPHPPVVSAIAARNMNVSRSNVYPMIAHDNPWLKVPEGLTLTADGQLTNGKHGSEMVDYNLNELRIKGTDISMKYTVNIDAEMAAAAFAYTERRLVFPAPYPISVLHNVGNMVAFSDEVREPFAVRVQLATSPARDFVSIVQIGTNSSFAAGHVVLAIVRSNEVTLWDPTGQRRVYDRVAPCVAVALSKATGRLLKAVNTTSESIYDFGPQRRFSATNLLCQSLVVLKAKDLMQNGFPGKLESWVEETASMDDFARRYMTFSAPDAKTLAYYQALDTFEGMGYAYIHGHLAGTSIHKWLPKAVADLGAMPAPKFDILQYHDETTVFSATGAVGFECNIYMSDVLETFLPGKRDFIVKLLSMDSAPNAFDFLEDYVDTDYNDDSILQWPAGAITVQDPNPGGTEEREFTATLLGKYTRTLKAKTPKRALERAEKRSRKFFTDEQTATEVFALLVSESESQATLDTAFTDFAIN